MTDPTSEIIPFDFEAHGNSALAQYSPKRKLYEDFALEIENILTVTLENKNLKISAIQSRAKDEKSFGKKATTPNNNDPAQPKYRNPLLEITDLAGVRVITFFPSTVNEVCQLVQEEFEIVERVDHTAKAANEERFGYLSVHYLVRLGSNRSKLSEYKKFMGLVAEIQIRTVLQHAWAEIEHDIRYKSPSAIPQTIGRRFMSLAGLLEIADREFEAIQTEDAELRVSARNFIQAGRLNEVEITADALRSYLDMTLGPDERISDFTYEWMAKTLRGVGFQNLGQIDECIAGRNDDKLSRVALGGRSGQVSRFEVLLVASMGDNFINKHPWVVSGDGEWFRKLMKSWEERLKQAGHVIGDYQPKKN